MNSAQTPVLSVRNLKMHFKSGRGKNKLVVKAVDGVNFDIFPGEVFGLVGESGCGKTTTGRVIIKLHDPTDGEVFFLGERIAAGTEGHHDAIKELKKNEDLSAEEKRDQISELKTEIKHRKADTYKVDRELMKNMQMIFQDPIESLNPRMTVKEIVAEGLRISGERHDKIINAKVN